MSDTIRKLHAVDSFQVKDVPGRHFIIEGFDRFECDPPDPLFRPGEIVEIDGARYEVYGVEAFVGRIRWQGPPIALVARPAP